MKIFKIPVPTVAQPQNQKLIYPKHNDDYGVEQDFELYLKKNPSMLVSNPLDADYHYLPIYWTRWHLNNNYGLNGIEELQRICDYYLHDDKKTFTICQYDDGPLVNIGSTLQFLSSRKKDCGIDIPLLSSTLRKPWFQTKKKKYLASFIGRLDTHIVRNRMQIELAEYDDVFIKNRASGTNSYVRSILSSYISLAPRGYGGSSFRFFESMQLGVLPMLIGDLDTRPFKKYIDWSGISLYCDDPSKLREILIIHDQKTLIEMGQKAKQIYDECLAYQKWGEYVIRSLEERI